MLQNRQECRRVPIKTRKIEHYFQRLSATSQLRVQHDRTLNRNSIFASHGSTGTEASPAILARLIKHSSHSDWGRTLLRLELDSSAISSLSHGSSVSCLEISAPARFKTLLFLSSCNSTNTIIIIDYGRPFIHNSSKPVFRFTNNQQIPKTRFPTTSTDQSK